MHPEIRGKPQQLIRRLLTVLLLPVPLVCSLSDATLAADVSRLLVYLEVPRTPLANTLELGELELRGLGPAVTVALRLSALDAEELADSQILLVSAAVPVGHYTEIRCGITGITGHVGVADVVPVPPNDGVVVPLDLTVQRDQTAMLFLEWRPAAIDSETEVHVPDLSVLLPTVPPLGSLAFITSRGSGSLVVANRLTGRVVAALAVDADPRGLAYSRRNQTLFVALADRDAIAVVDVISLRVINVVPLQFGDDPTRLLISRDEASLYVLNPGSRTLTGLSTWSLQQQFRFGVGDGPRSLAQDPVSGNLYVACENEGRIQVVDPGSGTLVTSLNLVSAPTQIVIDELSRKLLVGGSAQRTIRTFDLVAATGSGDQSICGTVAGLAVSTRTRRLYASVPSCRSLAVFRPDVGIEFGSIALTGRPGLFAFDQEFREIWAVLPDQGQVAVCNTALGRQEYLIEVDEDPFEVILP